MEAAYPTDQPKVLVRCISEGQSLELVENREGGVTILQNGLAMPGLDLTSAGVDGSVRVYMSMLRHRPHIDA